MITATAITNPNIAFIKYWGNLNSSINLPSNASISMNLECLQTRTQVQFDPALSEDQLWINSEDIHGPPLTRVARFLDEVRLLAGERIFATVDSSNNFPANAGLASSASAFAALALAASTAIGLSLSERELSTLARLGSGSAARSIPGGFVEWFAAAEHDLSYAESIAPPDYWDLVDVIAIIQEDAKHTTSTRGHALASSSPLQDLRARTASERLYTCRKAILERDFDRLAEVVELDSNLMHAAMMTSRPSLFYWEPATLAIMKSVPFWRQEGLQVCYTIDAGANVHLICTASSAPMVEERVRVMPDVRSVIVSTPGGAAMLVE